MAECILAEIGTLECSADPIPVTAAEPLTLAETILDVACNTAAYEPIGGLDGSINLTSTLNEVVIPLLDFPGAEARCVTNKDFSVTFSGLACPGDPGYECIFTKWKDCEEAFFRYRWLGPGAGLCEVAGVGFINLNLTNTVDDVARWSGTLNFRLAKIQNQA